MMKSKKTKIVLNGVLLAAMAALGITVYQVGTAPKKDKTQEGILMEEGQKDADNGGNTLAEGNFSDDADSNQNELALNEGDFGSENGESLVSSDTVTAEEEESEEEDSEEEDEDSTDDESEDTETTNASALTAPEINFSENTLMEWPVNGNILVDYSMDQTTYFPTLDQYRLSPAISVQAVEGAPVLAAANGTVFAVEQDAKTGTTVTMELGNGYQAVYGQLKDLMVEEGDVVTEGTIIGYINTPTKYYSTEGSNLYFAMKKDGEPIDPIMYLP